MKFKLPNEVKELTQLATRALQELGLQETTKITEIEAKQYAKDYSPSTKILGKCGDIKSDKYPTETLKIIDYCVFIMPKLIFDVILSADNETNLLSLLQKVNATLEDAGANGMARYLGKNFVPRFVDNKRIYQKVLWLEWLLTHALRLVDEGKIIDFYVPFIGGPKAQLTLRHKATKLFLDTYLNKHTDVTQELEKFRATYKEKTLNDSFMAAMRVFMPTVLEEKIESNNVIINTTTATLLSLTEEKKSNEEIKMPVNTPQTQESSNNNMQCVTEEESSDSKHDKEEEFFETQEWVDTVQPSKDANQSIVEVVSLELTLKDFQKSILASISDWVTKSHEMQSTTFYNLERDRNRARDLIALMSDAANKIDLKNKLAEFIKTGRTATDNTLSTFSRFDVTNSLCYHIAKQFCPATCEHTEKGWLGRVVLSDSREEIEDMLIFDFACEKNIYKMSPS